MDSCAINVAFAKSVKSKYYHCYYIECSTRRFNVVVTELHNPYDHTIASCKVDNREGTYIIPNAAEDNEIEQIYDLLRDLDYLTNSFQLETHTMA